MLYLLYTVFVIACVTLIVSILLQPGKADAGALFTNSISSTAFGPRGTQTLLAKISIGAAILFMLLAIFLSLPALTGTRSVLESVSTDANTSPSPAASASPDNNAVSPTPVEGVAPPATGDSNTTGENTITPNNAPNNGTNDQPSGNANNAGSTNPR